MLYGVHIPRCTHIKTNGTQCGSPALRGRRFCFFHKNWQGQQIQLNAQPASPFSFTMPVLEDADSIQVALMQVMRLILAGQLDPKIAGLLLYALQTASVNLRQMKLEPFHRESVVIDPRSVGDNNLGDDAWNKAEFEEDEEDEEEDSEAEEEGEEEEDTDEEDTDEEGEAEDSSEDEQEEDEPALPSKKPVQAVRAAGTERAQRACPERGERACPERAERACPERSEGASPPTKPHSSQNRASTPAGENRAVRGPRA
jgi:hypothetical protein